MTYNHVHTIKDLIYIQYSIILAREKFNIPDGIQIQYHHRGYVKSIFKSLTQSGKKWVEIISEIESNENKLKCAYCGNISDSFVTEPIIPKTTKIIEKISSKEIFSDPKNMVNVCPECNKLKNGFGLYEFYRNRFPSDVFFYEKIPSMVEKKYLSTIYYLHEFSNTLQKEDIDGDGKLTVLDIDFILH